MLWLKYLPKGWGFKRQTDLPLNLNDNLAFSWLPKNHHHLLKCSQVRSRQLSYMMLYLLREQLLQPGSSRGRLWPQIPGKQPHWTLVSVQPHHVAQVLAEGLGHLQPRPAFTDQACVQIWKIISCPIFIKNKYLFKIKIPPEFVFSFLSFFSCQKAKGISSHTENHVCPLFLLLEYLLVCL